MSRPRELRSRTIVRQETKSDSKKDENNSQSVSDSCINVKSLSKSQKRRIRKQNSKNKSLQKSESEKESDTSLNNTETFDPNSSNINSSLVLSSSGDEYSQPMEKGDQTKKENLTENILSQSNEINSENFEQKIITENIEKQEKLIQIKKSSNKIKNMSFNIDQAIKIIPEFDGSANDLDRFLVNANIIFKKIKEEDDKDFFKEFIKGRLKGKAFDFIKYKTITKFEDIESLLKEQFCESKSVEQLSIELGNCTQNYNEDIRSYANRIEQCLSKLVDACVKREGQDSVNVIQNIHSKTALRVFQDGLSNKDIRILVKAGNYSTMNDVISKAIEEEVCASNSSTNKSNLGNFQKNRSQCQLCKKFGHVALQCHSLNNQNRSNFSFRPSNNSNFSNNRTSNFNSPSYRNFSQNLNKSNPNLSSTMYYNRSVNNMSVTCGYCRKGGHHISVCRKRLFNESKRDSDKTNESLNSSINQDPTPSTSSMSGNAKKLDSKPSTSCRVKDA